MNEIILFAIALLAVILLAAPEMIGLWLLDRYRLSDDTRPRSRFRYNCLFVALMSIPLFAIWWLTKK